MEYVKYETMNIVIIVSLCFVQLKKFWQFKSLQPCNELQFSMLIIIFRCGCAFPWY